MSALEPKQPKTEYLLRIRCLWPLPADVPDSPEIVRLRIVLKRMLRRWGFRCVEAREVDTCQQKQVCKPAG